MKFNPTHSTKPQKAAQIVHGWKMVDLKGKVLGRSTTVIASYLQGKHKVQYSPHLDNGDNVVAINAKHIVLTGNKLQSKTYDRYSGYPGGRKVTRAADLLKTKPENMVKHAVSGMLPKNKLRDRRMTRLFVFPESNHTFADKFTETK